MRLLFNRLNSLYCSISNLESFLSRSIVAEQHKDRILSLINELKPELLLLMEKAQDKELKNEDISV